jgi:hypothetical protein
MVWVVGLRWQLGKMCGARDVGDVERCSCRWERVIVPPPYHHTPLDTQCGAGLCSWFEHTGVQRVAARELADTLARSRTGFRTQVCGTEGTTWKQVRALGLTSLSLDTNKGMGSASGADGGVSSRYISSKPTTPG